MKVLLIANYLHDRQESMLRFSAMLERGLSNSGLEVRVCRPPTFAGKIMNSDHGIGKWLGYVDKFVLFPTLLRRAARWADVVHVCDHSNAPWVSHVRNRPHVVTCHDMLGVREALLKRTRWTGRQLQRMILRGIIRAQHIACVSDATLAEVLRMTRLPRTRVSRVYNGLQYPYSPMAETEADARLRALGVNRNHAFVLHVGSNSWYKNREGVIRIFAALRRRPSAAASQLIMAGKPWTRSMRELISEEGLEGAVVELTEVTNEDLRALYSTARVMLYPSMEEGFGWPIIEAQACGCTVVTTNKAPMNEVGGAAAVYVDPKDIEGAAARVASVLTEAEQRRTSSLQNADRFSTVGMLDAYVALYRKVIHEYS